VPATGRTHCVQVLKLGCARGFLCTAVLFIPTTNWALGGRVKGQLPGGPFLRYCLV